MANGQWIDNELSSELPILRDNGEGQHIEFMVRYPSNGNELSKEIAAFASSNPGRIIIGVADDGALVGLEELKTSAGRDQLTRRIEGLCTNNVRPAITPVIKFAQEDEKNVLVIEVPRGPQPIYYNVNTPYVRHVRQSRPAEPHEVLERIIEWSRTSPLGQGRETSPEEAKRNSFLSSLGSALIDVLIYGDEVEERKINPWLDQLRFQLGSAGRILRELAATDIARSDGIDESLRVIADELEDAESHRLTMGGGSWLELRGHIDVAVDLAQEIKANHIDTVPLSDESKTSLLEAVQTNARKLNDLDRRAEDMANDGRMGQVRSEANEIGFVLLRVSYYRLQDQPDGIEEELRDIGHQLHLLETERLVMDGGVSMKRILDRLHALNEHLQALISQGD
jgi:ATP-dependent DNA helicase RecG